MKKIAVFTDCDLDGLACMQVYRWFTNNHAAEHHICSQSNFRKTFTKWAVRNNPKKYDKIFVMDLDVSQSNMDLVDHDNFVIIDHHDTHVANKDKYQHASAVLQDYTSCCKLIYHLFSKKYPAVTLTDAQKKLVLLTDDYDSYQLKLKDSYNLNVIVWNYAGDRAEQFTRDFGSGFNGFNKSHLNMIHLNNKKVNRIISELEVFHGEIPISGGKYKFYATVADKSLNEVAHHVINSYDCDICMVMNLRTQRVSFRKNKERIPDLDLGKLALSIAEGGGHVHSSGGKITDQVMTLTKMLVPV
jgi:oligoribonuclease NrnB/cAMP/cGMP phosphodiesterase (DHH superfamily)